MSRLMLGSITGRLAGGRGLLWTGSGDIDVDLADGGPEGPEGDGPYELTSGHWRGRR